jgi:hypothetical protein
LDSDQVCFQEFSILVVSMLRYCVSSLSRLFLPFLALPNFRFTFCYFHTCLYLFAITFLFTRVVIVHLSSILLSPHLSFHLLLLFFNLDLLLLYSSSPLHARLIFPLCLRGTLNLCFLHTEVSSSVDIPRAQSISVPTVHSGTHASQKSSRGP